MKDWKAIAEKLKEIVIHVGLNPETSTTSIVHALRETNCHQCAKFAEELSLLESQEVEGESAEEILERKMEFLKDKSMYLYTTLTKNVVIQAMEEYAQKSSNVTDEDIKAWIEKRFISDNTPYSLSYVAKSYVKDGMLIGAKAMRDNLIKPE